MVFELMNEPHDLDINVWAATCQKVVTGIRNAGASSQMILLPGTNFDSAATLVSSGSAAAMLNITNPDGTTTNLLLDIHKYLDEDNSGTHTACTTNNIDAFTTVAQFLRQSGRQGLISESGASSDATVSILFVRENNAHFPRTELIFPFTFCQCVTNFCAQNTFINQNADVFKGFVGWGAGSFDTSYILSLTPSKQNNQLVDNQIMQQCLIDVWADTVSTASPGSANPAAPATTATPAPSTVYITPVVTTTLSSSTPGVMETGPTSTLDWSTITAELGTGTSQGPLVTASKASNVAKTTQKVNSNVTGTTGAADSLLTATGSQNLTSAATAVATVVPTGASSKALERASSLILAMASAAVLLIFF